MKKSKLLLFLAVFMIFLTKPSFAINIKGNGIDLSNNIIKINTKAQIVNLGDDTVTINSDNAPLLSSREDPRVIGLVPNKTKLCLVESADEYYKVQYGDAELWVLKAYTTEGSEYAINKYTKYKQINEPWSTISYSAGNIGSSGCGPTSAAICASGLGCSLNPGQIVQAYKGGHLVASTWANRLLLDNIGYNLSENVGGRKALSFLAAGQPVICGASPGYYTSYGHFMALIGVRGNEVYLSDPYSYRETRNGWIDIDTLMDRGVDGFYVVSKK